ncbi:hypothetical protein [Olivibacter domesticus]|uniref:Uncharacterized protein n=2 Tax=Olivibacter domesticus TaxID=407022 RepID=A0A1H7W4Q1_OLID1|nr:hypothetical protein SAMN05661044_04400 [Olivibacter domesticus]
MIILHHRFKIMLTTITSLTFLGFFLLYNTSQKALLSSTIRFILWIKANPHFGKFIGLLLLLAALTGCILHFGLGAGIFSFFVILMTLASATVLLAPLRFVNDKTFLFIFSLSLIAELI